MSQRAGQMNEAEGHIRGMIEYLSSIAKKFNSLHQINSENGNDGEP